MRTPEYDKDAGEQQRLLCELNQRAAATAARAGGTGVAVIANDNFSAGDLLNRQRRNVQAVSIIVGHGQIEHLVEIAIVYQAVPADADEIAAHHLFERGPVEAALEEVHVRVVLAAQFKMRRVARDRHVAQTEKLIENDPKLLVKNLFIILFQLFLRRRQVRAHRIVDQIQN